MKVKVDFRSRLWQQLQNINKGVSEHTLQLNGDGKETNFVRKNVAPLTGAEVNLLSDETVQKLICYIPKDSKSTEHYTIGHLLGVQIIKSLSQ